MTQSPPEPLPTNVSQEERDTLEKWKDDDLQARCIMWASMSIEIHRQHEKYTYAKDILLHLQELFGHKVGPLDMRHQSGFFVLR